MRICRERSGDARPLANTLLVTTHVNTRATGGLKTMQLRQLGSNKTEVEFTDGTTVFFSYSTPVALQDAQGNYFRTEDFWSVTTSKHINQWLKSKGADYCDTLTQDSINARATA